MRLGTAALAAALLAPGLLAFGASPAAADFAGGNVVVLRVGTGGAALTSAATPVFLDEYDAAGGLVSSTPVRTSVDGANRALTVSGTATAEGSLTRSADGRFLTFAGYDAAPGTAAVTSSQASLINRVVAKVGADQIVDTSTALSDHPSVALRGVGTDEGTRFWTAGTSAVRTSTYGATTSTSLNNTLNARVVTVAGGQVYVTTAGAVSALGTGLPTSGAQAATAIVTRTGGTMYGTVLLDRSPAVPGVDTLYVADDSSSATGGIYKWSSDGTTWSPQGFVALAGARGLAGAVDGDEVDLTVTTTTSLSTLTDTAAYDAPLAGSPVQRASAPANTAFRGVALAPTGGAVATAPQITDQADDATVDSGTAATLSVVATGTSPLSYQWYQGSAGDTSTPVGSDSPSFTTPTLTEQTSYWVRVTNDLGSADSRTVTVSIAPPSCTATPTPIGAVQGAGDVSPMLGSTVTVRGTVVGDYEGVAPTLRGFYVQDAGDGNAATSDGLFVFHGSTDSVALGDVVEVTGTVQEFQNQTQLGSASVDVCGTGSTVPPADLTLPFTSADELERTEGMLVRLPQTLSVTEHFQLGRFGEVVVSSGGRLDQPTQVAPPGAAAIAIQNQNNLNRIKLDDALQNQNPDPIGFARGGAPLSASNTLRGGDTVTGAVGVLTYTWAGNAASGNAYRVRPAQALGGQAEFVAANPRPAAAPEVRGDLKVASANLLNYFNTFTGCTGGVGGAALDCRGADNATELERQAAKEVAALVKLDADVVGYMEMENDGYGADSAVQDLVNRLNAATAPGTWAFVDPDPANGLNAAGDDAIKVGLLYRPAAVTPVGSAAADTEAPAGFWDRVPVAQTFASVSDGGRFTVVANHFKSKGCTDAAGLDLDQGDGQGCWNARRTAQAERLATWLATDPTDSGDDDVMIVGDLNSYAQEDPIATLEAAGFVALADDDEYSYVFDGQWGSLDHALASASLAEQVTGAAPYHVNADEPSGLDYNINFKTPAQITSLYAADEFRTSDHDPLLVGLDLDTTGPVVAPTVVGDLGDGGWYVGDVEVSWSVTDPDTTVTSTTGCDPVTVDADTAGVTLTCTATSAGGTTTESVTVKRDATAPTVALSGGPADGATYVFGSVPPAPTCVASDALSGLAGCQVTGYSTAVGSHTVTATATDNAGNTATASRSYTVQAWTLNGFFSPVSMATTNSVKGGSTVPLKWEAFAGAAELTAPSSVASVRTAVCGSSTSTPAQGQVTYRDGKFQFDWTVPRQKGCRTVTVTMDDGSSLTARFQVR